MPTLWIPDGSTTLATPAAAYAGIRVPSRTTTQIGSLTPSDGSLIYDSTIGRFKHWSGGAVHQWARLDGDTFTGQVVLTGASSGVVLNVHGVTNPYIGTTDAQPLLFCTNNNNAQFGLLANGSVVIGVTSGGANSYLGFSTSYVGAGTVDIQLSRQGAGILSQRGGTQAQEFQTFGTYTDSTHSAKYFQGRYDGSYHYLGTEGASASGSGGGLKIMTSNSSGVATLAATVGTDQTWNFASDISFSGSMFTCSNNLTIRSGNSYRIYLSGSGVHFRSDNVIGFSANSVPSGGDDSGLSRLSAGLIGIGNGSLGDFSGGIKLTTVNIADGGNIILGTTTGTQIGTATTQKLGFWGKTPIVQPQLSTGVSHTVDDVIAIIQNLGLCHQ